MAQHVRMSRERKFGQFSSAADHFEEPGPRYRAAAFGVEDEAALQVLPSELAQCPNFLAGEWVHAVDTVFGPLATMRTGAALAAMDPHKNVEKDNKIAPPSSVMNSRRFIFAVIRSPRRRGQAARVGG